MGVMLPMMFESFDNEIGYSFFKTTTLNSPSNLTSPSQSPVEINKSPVVNGESPYTILPWRPFGSNPLGWAVSNVLLKGAEALKELQPDEPTAY
jgi:hypothetical protein